MIFIVMVIIGISIGLLTAGEPKILEAYLLGWCSSFIGMQVYQYVT